MGVGMPETIYLDIFGTLIRNAFGNVPYLVGSALTNKKDWRDVDIRLIIDDDEWEKWGFGVPENENKKWAAYCSAFSELGRKITGLPIDFQIQQRTYANQKYNLEGHERSAIGIMWKLESE